MKKILLILVLVIVTTPMVTAQSTETCLDASSKTAWEYSAAPEGSYMAGRAATYKLYQALYQAQETSEPQTCSERCMEKEHASMTTCQAVAAGKDGGCHSSINSARCKVSCGVCDPEDDKDKALCTPNGDADSWANRSAIS